MSKFEKRGRDKATLRIGAGAGQSDDRITPAVQLAEEGNLDFLVFECLAERTIARESLSRLHDEEKGYSPLLPERIRAVLPACARQGTRIVTNMGAANPLSGARVVRRIAQELGLGDVPCAVVLGDDVSSILRNMPELSILENGEPLESILPDMVSANAYLGADVVCEALNTGAPIVLTGRVADPSLFLAPMMHSFGWRYDDWPRLAAGTAAGHLLECTASVTGGCFAWPGKKDVEDLANVGYPFVDVSADGSVSISKSPNSGGRVDVLTCTEQLIYEMHDPTSYITPDCVLDITDVRLVDEARNCVRLEGARARPRTDSYKVVVGYSAGYIGEGEISYGGLSAVERAKMAAQLVKDRLTAQGLQYEDYRVDLIGMSSLHGLAEKRPEPYEVRLRIAARSRNRKAAQAVGFEVRALHMHGPGGGGGASDPRVREVLAVKSVLLPRNFVNALFVVEGNL